MTLYFRAGVTSDSTNSPAPQFEVVNRGNGPLSLNNVEVRYWFNCDPSTGSGPGCTLQAWVDWAGLLPAGTAVTGDITAKVQPASLGGQTNYVSFKFTGNLVLQPGQMIQVQSRFNKSDWSNMLQDNDWSFTPAASYVQWGKITGYLTGSLVWGQEPTAAVSALTASSVVPYPNPSTGSGTTLSVNLAGTSGTTAQTLGSPSPTEVDSSAEITLRVYTLSGRVVWTKVLEGVSFGTSGSHPVYWDERDFTGASLANGLYLAVATVKSMGLTTSASGKLLILR